MNSERKNYEDNETIEKLNNYDFKKNKLEYKNDFKNSNIETDEFYIQFNKDLMKIRNGCRWEFTN